MRMSGQANRMQTTKLGPLTVSRLCLGAMLMGDKTPAEESHRMLDRFLEAGGTFVDTADVYGDGESERTLAPWLARHREEVVVATKVRMKVSDPPGEGLAPDRVRAACDASLKRLGIDVIDLYQVHAPDPRTPLEETLEALDGLVRAGKVRAIGASNYSAERLDAAIAASAAAGGARYECLQPLYNLMDRAGFEDSLAAACTRHQIGVATYFSLASGFLSGKYRRAEDAAGRARAGGVKRHFSERGLRVLDALHATAERLGSRPATVALAWLMAQPTVTSAIASATSTAQLDDLLNAMTLRLDAAALQQLADASAG
jgi:aryl-alcohol dehydrogenase-like predicted oxidoreductase